MLKLRTLPPTGTLPVGDTVELPGRGSTFVVDTGEPGRPTIIALHALACTGLLTWYPVLDRLATKGRVVVFDQRWHGRGIRSPRFRLDDCADDVVALADVLGIDSFVAVGYSMGSLVAQLTWKRHPDRVAGLVLCATTHTLRRAPRERLALEAIARTVETFGPRAGPLPLGGPGAATDDRAWALEQFRQTSYGAVSGAIAEIGKFDSTDWLADIDVPTALVVTARDRIVPARRQRWIARRIPRATSYEVDCGHASVVLDADEFSSGLMPACASVLARLP